MNEADPTQSFSGEMPERRLKPGDRLAGRFLIVRFLAQGGMGEVYEAVDEHLQGKHCALKTLRPEIAANPVARQRFEREVLLAREVSHPNVCPTYDLFRVDTPEGPLLFLTMKLLRGESLGARLKREGAVDADISFSVARQMAAALDAAHQAGVIHRDFKPSNVMIEWVGDGPRVAITDFGVSRLLEADGTLAHTGHLVGTPGYIAPELLNGQPAGPASDVYAFGVVLHEMLTGHKPKNRPGRLGFERPSKVSPDVPRAWDKVVLGCLEHDPARRSQSAGEALAALEATTVSGRATTPPRRTGSRRRLLATVAAAAALLAVAVWLNWWRIYALLHPLPKQRYVALFAWPPAEDPDLQPLLRGIIDSIGNRLARAESAAKDFVVISAGDTPLSPRTLTDAGGSLGANLVLGAALRLERGGGGVVALRVYDTASGAALRQRELSLPGSQLPRLAERAASASAQLLGLPGGEARRSDQEELANLSPEAYRLYLEAEALRDRPNDTGLDGAIEKYQKALETAPRFAAGYASLSQAYTRKFFRTNDRPFLNVAARNADLAVRYNPRSARAAHAKALVALYAGETERAMKELGDALALDPGNPRMMLHQALAFRDLGRQAEEEAVYRRIIRERPNFWPAHNELGSFHHRHGRYEAAAAAFGEAAAVAALAPTPLANQGTMFLLLGRDKDAEDAFRRSLDRGPNRVALMNLGSLVFKRGDYRKALEYYEKARDLRPGDSSAWRNIADCLARLGDRAGATENYCKAADLLGAALKENPRPATLWNSLAYYRSKCGRRGDAEAALRTAELQGAAGVQTWFMRVQALAVLGRREEALQLLLKCLDQGLSTLEVDLALDLESLRADPRYRRAIAIRKAEP
jgi:tetratricopeptide (TPR) repeat protein/tRNA A-37 threonylcarbamoyl transferase component Bud32